MKQDIREAIVGVISAYETVERIKNELLIAQIALNGAEKSVMNKLADLTGEGDDVPGEKCAIVADSGTYIIEFNFDDWLMCDPEPIGLINARS